MNITLTHIGKAISSGIMLLAVLSVIAGCAGIQPYSPPNHREEGPAKGLFTGSQGEWVIVGPKALETGEGAKDSGTPESEIDREEKKDPVKPSGIGQ